MGPIRLLKLEKSDGWKLSRASVVFTSCHWWQMLQWILKKTENVVNKLEPSCPLRMVFPGQVAISR